MYPPGQGELQLVSLHDSVSCVLLSAVVCASHTTNSTCVARFTGTNLINLMGSNGTKAVAAALLGAEVTCVDISPSNAQYGRQLAQAAGVDVEFVAADVLALPDKILTGVKPRCLNSPCPPQAQALWL